MSHFGVSDINAKASFLPRVKVIGVGGGGGNAVANMIHYGLTDVEFWVANTDLQALADSPCGNKIQIGSDITNGLGAGSDPDIGAKAALESKDQILACLKNAHVVFIAAGMGGGTGTGAAPVIAKILKEEGILTIGVVTKPFSFEGSGRVIVADLGIEKMEEAVDTLVIVMNQYLFRVSNENTPFIQAFKDADKILYDGVRCISDLFTKPGLINLDLADVRSVISSRGIAMIGMGEASGLDRAERAVELSITNPLLDETILGKAEALLLNISGSADMTLFEIEKISNAVRDKISITNPDTKFIIGTTLDGDMQDGIRVSVVAAGVKKKLNNQSLSRIASGKNNLNSNNKEQFNNKNCDKNIVDLNSISSKLDINARHPSNAIDTTTNQKLNPYYSGINENINANENIDDIELFFDDNQKEGGQKEGGQKEEESQNNFTDSSYFGSGVSDGYTSGVEEKLVESDFNSKVSYSNASNFTPNRSSYNSVNDNNCFNIEIPKGVQSRGVDNESSLFGASAFAEEVGDNSNNQSQLNNNDNNNYNNNDNDLQKFDNLRQDSSVQYLQESDDSNPFINYNIDMTEQSLGASVLEGNEDEDKEVDLPQENDGGFLNQFIGSIVKKFHKQKDKYERNYHKDASFADVKKK
ncbi:MAG: cell division protein FtsZ [Alphaproteobacteria bacterium]|nr:cell division protein FtsZ [Rickettsiales bacterium]